MTGYAEKDLWVGVSLNSFALWRRVATASNGDRWSTLSTADVREKHEVGGTVFRRMALNLAKRKPTDRFMKATVLVALRRCEWTKWRTSDEKWREKRLDSNAACYRTF
ncbi:hypothetical protein TNIN_216371 [Trichonephila inaurata madagascariensis]|uniref:Uncharacterized protein n=1 Tax=Trichonephila inaurata madagascariensis TaxID=2747483 RepID=A0A8X7CT26_9ARAC|nr:hypothetical protein TNIN_216371 [Trichonephila inaurata madagascariensis]